MYNIHISAGHMTFSQSDPSNRSHDRLFNIAVYNVSYVIEATHIACLREMVATVVVDL